MTGCMWKPATKESMMAYLGFVPHSADPTYSELAEVLMDVLELETAESIYHNTTSICLERCKEIIEIRNKLI